MCGYIDKIVNKVKCQELYSGLMNFIVMSMNSVCMGPKHFCDKIYGGKLYDIFKQTS